MRISCRRLNGRAILLGLLLSWGCSSRGLSVQNDARSETGPIVSAADQDGDLSFTTSEIGRNEGGTESGADVPPYPQGKVDAAENTVEDAAAIDGTNPLCGNGIVDPDEDCDLGPLNGVHLDAGNNPMGYVILCTSHCTIWNCCVY